MILAHRKPRKGLTDFERIAKLWTVLAFAADAHAQTPNDNAPGTPYIQHPIALVNALVQIGGVTDMTVLSVALLHDTVEKAGISAQQLREQFGPRITNTVMELTDDPALSEIQRREAQVVNAPNISDDAKLVKLADKLCNLRAIVAARQSAHPSLHDSTDHFNWCSEVVDGLRGINPALETAFDDIWSHRP